MKLKISGGYLKNSNLIVPETAKPVKNIVKQSLFSYLGNDLKEKKVLDLFAGSGNLGIEAISRGAKFVTFVENNYRAYKNIQENLVNLNLTDRAEVIRMDCLKFIGQASEDYDLVFADPPYETASKHFLKTVHIVVNSSKPEGLLIYFHQNNLENREVENMELLETRTFGKSGYSVYKKI